jgi:glycosyltransferase involved in cell wall biosynthesis
VDARRRAALAHYAARLGPACARLLVASEAGTHSTEIGRQYKHPFSGEPDRGRQLGAYWALLVGQAAANGSRGRASGRGDAAEQAGVVSARNAVSDPATLDSARVLESTAQASLSRCTILIVLARKTQRGSTHADARRRLAVLVSFSGEGGVERMVLNLLEGIAARGVAVDLLAIRAESAHLGELPRGVRLIDLGVRHSGLAVIPLARYLRRERPAAMLAAKDRAIRAAILARRLAGWEGRLVGRLGTNLSAALAGRSAVTRWLRTAPMRYLYPGVDRIIAVSEGVAEDTLRITRLPSSRVAVVRNPVVTARLVELAEAPCPHPWLAAVDAPVVLAAGRLTEQKGFAVLLRAFARMRRQCPARLIILGEGPLRRALVAAATELGVNEHVALPGFAVNPYAWMSRASLFVLSSAWEGSPNVLTEALALGVPVLSTDCPSGPREILAGGRYGTLVPVGDDAALAEAMQATLAAPLPATVLREAVAAYTVEAATQGYLTELDLVAA